MRWPPAFLSMSLRRFLQAALASLFIVGACAAQGTRLDAPKAATLRLVVSVDGDATQAVNVTVELMDALGSGGAMNRKLTDHEGGAIFQTVTGIHRVRITGPDIRDYEGDLEIMPNEMMHLERIRVQSKEGSQQGTQFPINGLVSATRLTIPESARKDFEKGAEAMRQQHWPESRALFESAIQKYPQYDVAYNSLGIVQSHLNDVEASRQAFSKAIEINPAFAEAYRNLARILMADRNYKDAAALLNKSLSTDPLNVWALVTAANAELITHDYDQAIAHARKAHTMPHPGMAGAHIVAALALEAQQHPAEAIAEYRVYLQEDPSGRDAPRARAAIARLTATAPK